MSHPEFDINTVVLREAVTLARNPVTRTALAHFHQLSILYLQEHRILARDPHTLSRALHECLSQPALLQSALELASTATVNPPKKGSPARGRPPFTPLTRGTDSHDLR